MSSKGTKKITNKGSCTPTVAAKRFKGKGVLKAVAKDSEWKDGVIKLDVLFMDKSYTVQEVGYLSFSISEGTTELVEDFNKKFKFRESIRYVTYKGAYNVSYF